MSGATKAYQVTLTVSVTVEVLARDKEDAANKAKRSTASACMFPGCVSYDLQGVDEVEEA